MCFPTLLDLFYLFGFVLKRPFTQPTKPLFYLAFYLGLFWVGLSLWYIWRHLFSFFYIKFFILKAELTFKLKYWKTLSYFLSFYSLDRISSISPLLRDILNSQFLTISNILFNEFSRKYLETLRNKPCPTNLGILSFIESYTLLT